VRVLKSYLLTYLLSDLLGLEPVGLMTVKGRRKWFGEVERRSDADWTKRCTSMKVDGIRRRGRSGTNYGIVLNRI